MALGFACAGSSSHPVPLGALPPGEHLLTVDQIDGTKQAWVYSGGKGRSGGWDLVLQHVGTSSGGDTLSVLEDGRVVFCGSAFTPRWVNHCWVIEQGKSRPIGPPVMPQATPQEGLLPDPPGFGANGTWWRVGPEGLLLSPTWTDQPKAVPLPFTGRVGRVAHAPTSGRLVVSEGQRCTQIWVIEPDGTVIDQRSIDHCQHQAIWSPDGDAIALKTDAGLEVWTPGAGSSLLLARGKGPDGHAEVLQVGAWLSGGEHLLFQSSRHRPMTHNRCAGVSNHVMETYLIELSTERWTRLPSIRGPVQALPSPSAKP